MSGRHDPAVSFRQLNLVRAKGKVPVYSVSQGRIDDLTPFECTDRVGQKDPS